MRRQSIREKKENEVIVLMSEEENGQEKGKKVETEKKKVQRIRRDIRVSKISGNTQIGRRKGR